MAWASGIIIVVALIVFAFFTSTHNNTPTVNPNGRLQIVAAENFWGSLASQIGGSQVQVKSIITDPNADPHEYESNTADARAIATANFVIINGAGYDSWANKLLSASPSSTRQVLDVASLLGKKNGDNPHFWYSPMYVNKVTYQILQDLIRLEPNNKSYFSGNYQKLMTSLKTYQNRIADIKRHFSGVKVAATEDIFYYLAQASGLNLVSPPAFTEAVAEGNDPPAGSVVTFEQQLESGQVKLLVYNTQTVTPLTSNMKDLALTNNIPIVGVSEIIEPPNTSFQNWMNGEIINIENALNMSVKRSP